MSHHLLYPPNYVPRPLQTYTQAARQDFAEAVARPSHDSDAEAARALDTAVSVMVANGIDYPPVPRVYFVAVPNDKPLPEPPRSRTKRALSWLCCGARR